MTGYIIRRLLLGVPTVLGVLLITFMLFFMVATPENMALRSLGEKATKEQIQKWIIDHKYDLPSFINTGESGISVITKTRIFNHYHSMLTFNFGRSDLDDILITKKIKDGIGPSLALTVPSFLIGITLAILFSLFLSFYRNTYFDKLGVMICVLGMSTVIFIYIIGGQFFFGKILRWFPISGWHPDHLFHFLLLPVIISILAGLGESTRFYRTIMINEISNDYIRTARSKGLSEPFILFKHLLKNAMIPILTQVVMVIPFLFTGSLLIESFFSIPGLGKLTVEAILNNDFSTISAMVSIGSMFGFLPPYLLEFGPYNRNKKFSGSG